MKIVVASFYLPPTDRIGSGVQMHMLANEYARMGHDVTLISPSPYCEPDALYTFTSVELKGANRTLKWAIFLSRHHFDADFIHINGDDYLMSSTTHCPHLRTFMGSCLAESFVASGIRNRLRMLWLGLTEVISSIKFPLTTVISADTNRFLARNGRVIPCGIDLSAFSPGNQKHLNPVVLFVGTLDSRKRGRHLLQAFVDHVKPNVPDAELWIVRETSQVNVPGVTVFGSVSQAKLIDLYRRAWVFCLPSSYEGFGVPYVEAMACGTPVVATNNAGSMTVLGSGTYGSIVTLDKMGDELCLLLSDSAYRDALTLNGLNRARSYDIRNVAQQYIDLVVASSQ